jgi:OOP family OmpA-OmpF porin
MNLSLSQSRANAVLNALMSRRILTTGLTAKGYGETVPIADNSTEEGREANRRIEFTLIRPKPTAPETPTALEQQEAAQPAAPTETPDE